MPIARSLKMVAVAALALTGTTAWGASEPGWYYGLSGGRSNADIKKADLDDLADFVIFSAGTPLTSSSTFEDGDTTWSLLFGYQFSPYLAVEAGYLNLGSFPYHYTGTVDLVIPPTGVAPSSFDFEYKAVGYPLSVLGILPLGPVFELHGRLGLLFSNPEVRTTATAGNNLLVNKFAASSQDFFYGAGAAANLGETWSISLDYQKYNSIGDGDVVPETDFDSITLSLIYRLGPF